MWHVKKRILDTVDSPQSYFTLFDHCGGLIIDGGGEE